jgi:hypothetical protein
VFVRAEDLRHLRSLSSGLYARFDKRVCDPVAHPSASWTWLCHLVLPEIWLELLRGTQRDGTINLAALHVKHFVEISHTKLCVGDST